VQIRILGIDDYAAVMDLWKRSCLSSLRPDGRDSRAAFVQQLGTGTGARGGPGCQTVLGLENEGQLIGVVVATHDGRKGWINRLAIDPGHRRRGHAKQLIAAAENALKAQDIHVIAALIESENEDSLALFQKVGYVLHQDVYYLSKRESAKV
jgi:ribosomal protein S18 acetylase RimI-like enzyme